MANRNTSPKPPTSGRARGRWLMLGIAGLIAAVLGGTALTATAHSDKHDGGNHGAWGGHNKGPFSERKIDFMLDRLDATPEQREKVKTILSAAREDMRAMHDSEMGGREAFMAALTKSDIDRRELETLRKGHIEAFDKASERMVEAMADAAEVLTPDQRAELAEMARKMGHHRSGHMNHRDDQEKDGPDAKE